jgi:two-component system, sensor histidine kinase and response regulator
VASSVDNGSSFRFKLAFDPGHTKAPEMLPLPPGLRVLLIMEHPTNLRVLSTQLMSWRLNVATATSVVEGLGCWKDMCAGGRAPDLVVVDRRLPDQDGVWLGAAIRELDPLKQSRLILFASLNEPINPEDRAAFEHVVTKPVKLDAFYSVLAESGGKTGRGAPPAASDSGFKGCRVLLVDDNAVNRKVGERLLQRLGASVALAGNGVEALSRLRSSMFDVVLMDCQMPEMDGYEATRQIRRGSGVLNPEVPVIALTANALSGDRDLCIAAGMNDYLTKPIEATQLAEALNTALMETAKPRVAQRMP